MKWLIAVVSLKQGVGSAQKLTISGKGGSVNTSNNAGDDVLKVKSATSEEFLTLFGGAGNDNITGGNSIDYIDAGTGNDVIKAGIGDDYLLGGDGNDTLDGGSGNDILSGGAGNDVLIDGAGGDDIFGGAGDDTITLKSGDDVVGFASNSGTDTVKGLNLKSNAGANADRIAFLDLGTTSNGSVDFDAVVSSGNNMYGFTSFDQTIQPTSTDGSYYETDTFANLSSTQSAHSNKVVVLNSTNQATLANTATVTNLTNAYVLLQNGKNTEIYFDADWSNTEGRSKIAILTGVKTADLDVTDFGIYNDEGIPAFGR